MSLFQNFQPSNKSATMPSANQQGGAAANPTVPSDTTVPTQVTAGVDGKPAAAASPMDKFKDLWETDANSQQQQEPLLKSDPQALMQAAQSVDFLKVITPELQAKIQAGGAEGMQAMTQAMNEVARMTFAQSAHATSSIVEQALAKQQERFKEMLPTLIKQHQANDTLRSSNPLMNDPAMAPMVEALQSQFSRKFPQATVAEINNYVNEYLNGAADKISGLRPQPTNTNKRTEQDWSNFF